MPTKKRESFSVQTLRLFVPNYGPLADRDVYRRHIVAGERAEAEGIAILTPSQSAKVEDLLLAHTPEYVEAVRSSQPAGLASTGGEWFLGSIDVSLSVRVPADRDPPIQLITIAGIRKQGSARF